MTGWSAEDDPQISERGSADFTDHADYFLDLKGCLVFLNKFMVISRAQASKLALYSTSVLPVSFKNASFIPPNGFPKPLLNLLLRNL